MEPTEKKRKIKKTSVSVDPQVWSASRQKAIGQGTDISAVIQSYLEKWVSGKTEQTPKTEPTESAGYGEAIPNDSLEVSKVVLKTEQTLRIDENIYTLSIDEQDAVRTFLRVLRSGSEQAKRFIGESLNICAQLAEQDATRDSAFGTVSHLDTERDKTTGGPGKAHTQPPDSLSRKT